ncbi:hypothetical protein BASA62_008784 [Batrachochytrium salamandrivorans]|nr:hypothetical protein BASA62_008784 [Batrachochytrium salamandrivorans]
MLFGYHSSFSLSLVSDLATKIVKNSQRHPHVQVPQHERYPSHTLSGSDADRIGGDVLLSLSLTYQFLAAPRSSQGAIRVGSSPRSEVENHLRCNPISAFPHVAQKGPKN